MDFVALTAFNLVAAHGGFGRASRATGRPKGTLSRQVKELEDALGVRLLERSSQSLRLTDEGQLLHVRTHGLLGEIEEIGESISVGLANVRGRLRVSSPMMFAQLTMGGIGADFAMAYPDVQLEITAEDRFVELIEEGYDLVIRGNPHPSHDLVGRCFLRDEMIVVASPTVPQPIPPIDPETPVQQPAVVRATARADDVWHCGEGATRLSIRPLPVIRLSADLMIYGAVKSGIGAALLPRSIVAEDLATGQLVSWGIASGRDSELWVLHPSRRLISSKVAAFIRFLCDRYPRARWRTD